ncbi:MAG: HNH endonuclease signature motif containing protein [Sphingomonadaceae bacterium]
MSYCRECMKAYNAERKTNSEYWAKQLERGKANKRKWRSIPKNQIRESARRSQQYASDPKLRARCQARRVTRRNLEAQGPGRTEEEWTALKAKYGNKCLACGSHGRLVPDHVMPLSQGGPHTIANIQPLCLSCNAAKKDRTIDYRQQ